MFVSLIFKMPTKILYHEAYFRPRDGLSFFGYYDSFAVSGSSGNSGKANSEKSEIEFLSRPLIWAQYVVDGIKAKYLEWDKQLRNVGQFLFDASFFGFSFEGLAKSHLSGIKQYYASAEELLRDDERTKYVSPEAIDHILGVYSVRARTTTIPTGNSKKEKFVLNTPTDIRNFWNTMNRVLEGNEIKHYLAEDIVRTAWAGLRNGAGPSLHNIIEEEYEPPKKEYPLPPVDLFTYAAEMERRIMAEERIRQIKAERDMHIQSDLGRIICELIGEVPPKKERQRVLDGVEKLVSQYEAVIKQNGRDALAAELAEVVRRVDVLGQGVNNLYTRKLRGMFRPLEKLIRV